MEEKPNQNTTVDLLVSIKQLFPRICIIAAGGISLNNMDIFFKLGAVYVQLGSAFMMTSQSNLPTFSKQFIQNNFKTVVSKNITGKYARGILNELIDGNSVLEYEFPLQHYHTSNLRKLAKSTGNYQLQSLWIGSNSDNIKLFDLDELIRKLKLKYIELKI